MKTIEARPATPFKTSDNAKGILVEKQPTCDACVFDAGGVVIDGQAIAALELRIGNRLFFYLCPYHASALRLELETQAEKKREEKQVSDAVPGYTACRDCKYFLGSREMVSGRIVGTCVRFPPVPTHDLNAMPVNSRQPRVSEDSSCGEFKKSR
jgi:hypothetical protein